MATEPCNCGNQMPRLEKIMGRAADFFWVRSGTGLHPLTAYPFQHAFDYRRGLRAWQAEQVERNSIVVRLEAIPAAVPVLAVARKRLEERLSLTGLLLDLEIRMETVRRLATDERTLKFRRMISRVGTPEDMNLPLKGGL